MLSFAHEGNLWVIVRKFRTSEIFVFYFSDILCIQILNAKRILLTSLESRYLMIHCCFLYYYQGFKTVHSFVHRVIFLINLFRNYWLFKVLIYPLSRWNIRKIFLMYLIIATFNSLVEMVCISKFIIHIRSHKFIIGFCHFKIGSSYDLCWLVTFIKVYSCHVYWLSEAIKIKKSLRRFLFFKLILFFKSYFLHLFICNVLGFLKSSIESKIHITSMIIS